MSNRPGAALPRTRLSGLLLCLAVCPALWMAGCSGESDPPALAEPELAPDRPILTPVSQINAVADGSRTDLPPEGGTPVLDTEARFLVNPVVDDQLSSLWVCPPQSPESSIQFVAMTLLENRGGLIALDESPVRNLTWDYNTVDLNLVIEQQAEPLVLSAVSRTSETAFSAELLLGSTPIDTRGCYMVDPATGRPLDDEDLSVISDPARDDRELQLLLGRVEFTYRFVPSSTGSTYRDVVVFQSDGLVSAPNGSRLLTGFDGTADYVCLYLAPVDSFMCLHTPRLSQNIDVFLFTMGDDGTGSGTYEYCLEGQSPGDCGEAVVSSPDGTVDVTVTAVQAGLTLADDPDGSPATARAIAPTDAAAYKFVDEQATGTTDEAPISTSTRSPSAGSMTAAQMRDAVQLLLAAQAGTR